MQGIGFDEMVRHQQQVAAMLAADPNILEFGSNIGVGGPGGGGAAANTGRMIITMKPRAERTHVGGPGDRVAQAEDGGRFPASACSWSTSRPSTSAARGGAQPVPVHTAEP